MNGLKVGDRVGHSAHVLNRKRDYWNSCGREPMKSGAKAALDKAIAERGTVTALLPGDRERGVSPGLEVTWDDGAISRCLSHMVAKVEPPAPHAGTHDPNSCPCMLCRAIRSTP